MDNEKTIAYQGRPGAYSHLACKKAFPNCTPISCETFEEVFEKTENKMSDMAFIPIENSQAGRVADIHNLLPKSNLLIIGEYFHQVCFFFATIAIHNQNSFKVSYLWRG